ncbi:MAG TPA: hypothetical protein VN238_04575, partial [Solirubrobacteraceae bacterium]|nr:hypothetical protein [Solirubrobacteraceae bacterium]
GAGSRAGGGTGAEAGATAGSPVTVRTTRTCSRGRCRVVLRATVAKGKRVVAVRAKVATCLNARCTKRRTTTFTLRRGEDGTYVLRVTLKRGRYRVDVSSRERSGGRWQAPVRRTLTIR